MPSGRRWGLISLGAVPAGGCQLGQDLGLAAGQSVDKVRGPDQPDVVSSPSARFVGFAFNTCFAFLIHSETLNHSLVFWLPIRAAPKSQICWWGQFRSSQDPLAGRSKDPCRKCSVMGLFASKLIVLQNPCPGRWALAVGGVHSLVCRRAIPG